jgi:hypothetical protein
MRTARNSEEVRMLLSMAARDARRSLTQQLRDLAPRPVSDDDIEVDDEQP